MILTHMSFEFATFFIKQEGTINPYKVEFPVPQLLSSAVLKLRQDSISIGIYV